MKNLTLSSLLLSAIALATLAAQPAQAASEYFCSLATVDTDASVSFEGGKEKLADTCTIAGGKKLTLSGTSPTALSSGAGPATIDMTRSIIGDGATLWYFAGTEGTMANSVPFVFRLTATTFNRNAVLIFQGSFPKDSVIEVRGNTWIGITSPPSLYGSLASHAIFFYTDSTQRLDERAKIRITGNTIPVSVSNVAYAIGINSNMAMYASSLIEISGNDLSCRTTAANLFPAVIGWGFTSSFSIQGDDASVIINNNKISAGSDALGMYLPPFNSGPRTFNLNITNNRISLEGSSFFPIRARGLSVAKDSRVYIANNTMNSVGTDSRVLIADLSIGGAAIVKIINNKHNAYGGNAVISFDNSAQIGGSSQLSVEFNDIVRSDDFSNGAPAIQFIGSLTMSGTSVTSLSYNLFDAAGTPHYMVWNGNSGVTKSDSAKFFVCNNMHYDSVLTSFSTYLTPGIFAAMENQTLCLARTTAAPPTTTTARSTTSQAPTTSTAGTIASTTTGPTLPSGISVSAELTDANSTSVNETSMVNGTITDEVTDALTSTFAPGVSTTSAPLNNECGGRTGVALLCATVLGAVISLFA